MKNSHMSLSYLWMPKLSDTFVLRLMWKVSAWQIWNTLSLTLGLHNVYFHFPLKYVKFTYTFLWLASYTNYDCPILISSSHKLFYVQWGEMFEQLQSSHSQMRELCIRHHRWPSSVRDRMLIFKEFICKSLWKINIRTVTKVQHNT